MLEKNQNLFQFHFRKDLPPHFNEANILKKHSDRVVNMFNGTTLPPYEVLIHPSSACNLCCEWCIGDHVPVESITPDGIRIFKDVSSKGMNRLPDYLHCPENMLKVVRGIVDYKKNGKYKNCDGREISKEFKVEAVSFSGLTGEPLVGKRAVVEAMNYLLKHDIRIGIFTNGILMDEWVRETLVRIAYVHFSLDAASTEIYGKLKYGSRRNGERHYGQALKNLSELVKLKERTSNSSLEINASFVLYPGNFHEVYDAAQILRNMGVQYFRVKQDNSGFKLLSLTQRKEARVLLDKIEDNLVDDRFRLVRIHDLSSVEEMKRTFSTCFITELMAAIGSDGNLYPCNYHPAPGGMTYGNAIEKPFGDIWEGCQRKKMKSKIPCNCPAVCDPFKNRANRLLNTMHHISGIDGNGITNYSMQFVNKENV